MTVCYDTVLYNICDIFAELNLFVSRAETLSTSTIILPSCISLCFWFPHSSIFMELKAPIKLVKGWKSSQLELLHSAIYPKDFVRLCLCNMIIQSICCPLVSPEGRLWSHIGVAEHAKQKTIYTFLTSLSSVGCVDVLLPTQKSLRAQYLLLQFSLWKKSCMICLSALWV